jgi:hypothetical protein
MAIEKSWLSLQPVTPIDAWRRSRFGVPKVSSLSQCHTTASTEHPRSVLTGMEPAAGVAKLH